MLTHTESYQHRLRSHLAIARPLVFDNKETAPIFLMRSPLFLLEIIGPVYSKHSKYGFNIFQAAGQY